jgi:hypothetical protein
MDDEDPEEGGPYCWAVAGTARERAAANIQSLLVILVLLH